MSFQREERVLCFHGPLLYEAKILKAENWNIVEYGHEAGPHYFVHYKGWKQSWDEWVPESRVLKFTDENIQKQKELQGLYSQKKEENKKPQKAQQLQQDQQQQQQRKRMREQSTVEREEDYLKRPEIRIPIPDALKVQLVDDWEYITKDQRMVSLPRSPTVKDILLEYKQIRLQKKTKEAPSDDFVEEVIDGLMTYFDKALGTILLYRFERPQYADFIKRNPDKRMSEVYGAEHLLRLFVQLPMLIAHTTMDQESIRVLREQLHLIMMFMQKNFSRFFLSEYENAPPEYVHLY